MTITEWTIFGALLGIFLGGGFYMRPRRPKPLPKRKRTAYLVAQLRQIPEYPYFAVENVGTYSDAQPTMNLSLMPVTILEADGDDYGKALEFLKGEMRAQGIPANVIDEVVG